MHIASSNFLRTASRPLLDGFSIPLVRKMLPELYKLARPFTKPGGGSCHHPEAQDVLSNGQKSGGHATVGSCTGSCAWVQPPTLQL